MCQYSSDEIPDMRDLSKVRILNLDILSIRKTDLMEKLHDGVMFTPNVDHLVRLQKNPEFYRAYQQADWIVCDSVILQRLSWLLRNPIAETIPGSTFFLDFCDYHQHDEECKIFILGGKKGVPQKAMDNINKRTGRSLVIDAYSPSFSFVKDEEESGQIVEIINESEATVLMVCATFPKQEMWIAKYRHQLANVKLFMALGATVDFVAGTVKRCPLLLQRLGVEWFWRFCHEPQRLFRRYFVDDIQFFWFFGKQLLGLYKNPFA